jgi:hypothetical protein
MHRKHCSSYRNHTSLGSIRVDITSSPKICKSRSATRAFGRCERLAEPERPPRRQRVNFEPLGFANGTVELASAPVADEANCRSASGGDDHRRPRRHQRLWALTGGQTPRSGNWMIPRRAPSAALIEIRGCFDAAIVVAAPPLWTTNHEWAGDFSTWRTPDVGAYQTEAFCMCSGTPVAKIYGRYGEVIRLFAAPATPHRLSRSA